MRALKTSKENLKEIITALRNGAVLVLPTDTVYGLVCDAKNEKAVEKIFKIKKREKTKPLAVFVKDINQAKEYAIVSNEQEEFLKKNWPGAVTVILDVLPAQAGDKGLSGLVYKNSTIGLRMPNYDLLNLILDEIGTPLAQTSANMSGEDTLVKIAEVKSQFKDEDVLIIDAGDLLKRNASSIIDLTNDTIKIIR
jgi:L-threonylcarbamoyladenylate synthase